LLGAVDAQYDIEATSLPRPHAGCLLEKASISAGKIVTGGLTFAVGVRDVPPHVTRKGYIPKLRWIATKHVVLWDERDKRGWLVNGISALLHLVRASLEQYRTDEFSDSFLFDQSKMKDAAEHKPNSAHKFLANEQNRGIVINRGEGEEFEEEEIKQKGATIEDSNCWKKKRGYYRFEDLVEQRFNTLEQAMDYQRHVLGQNGVNMKVRLRKHLDGWDFTELATDHDPYPRVATLQALGYGWVDFIHSIEAITLLGRGFGDIIRPMEFDGMCSNWRGLPTKKYYLGASVFDLKNIMKKFGDTSVDPIRLCHDLLWHCPGDIIAPCWCQKHSISQMIRKTFKLHHDPVQVLYPKRSRLVLPLRGPGKLKDDGAVVFGHSIDWGYRWRENGNDDLEIGDPPPSISAPEHVVITAGLRPSSGSSTTSGSSQSHESTGAAMMRSTPLYSSPSVHSAKSTPVESITDSAQDLAPMLSDQAHWAPESSQERRPVGKRPRTPELPEPVHDIAGLVSKTEREEKRPRTLRHEPRRL
jgi:hypothetical protein